MTALEANSVNDSVVVVKLRTGKEDGVRQLLRDYGPKVMWLLRDRFGYILPDPDLEAVLNDATFRVFRSIRIFDPAKGSLSGWYWRIAANAARDLLRGQARHAHAALDVDLSWQDRQAASVEEQGSTLVRTVKDLHGAIEKLPDLQRRIIKADLNSGDLADARYLATKFGTTEASIYMSRSKGRETLRLAMIHRGYFQD